MRLIATLFPGMLLLMLLVSCRPGGHSVPQAIVGAMLIDGTAKPPVANAAVLVNRGKIEALGPAASVRIPGGYTRVDADGRFLFPADLTQPVRVGGEATFLLLSVNPALDPDYLKSVVGRMENGRWAQYPR